MEARVVTLRIAIALLLWAAVTHADGSGEAWRSTGQNVDLRGPHASFQSRQRRRLLQRLFPGATDYPRDLCRFALPAAPDRPNPPYRARSLVLECTSEDGMVRLGWPRRP